MPSKRYTVVIADRSSGVVRRMTISLRPAAISVIAILAMPILMGLGARWSMVAEMAQLRTTNSDLTLENVSFRKATTELTSQISSLQIAISDLSERSQLDPAAAQAMTRMPSLLRPMGVGGATKEAQPLPTLPSAMFSPESTFGVLQELLGALENRLQLVRTGVEHRARVAAAMPSIWPAHGWLSAGFGKRRDPFTGGLDFHPALDISGDAGQPVYATGSGIVESTARNGNYGNLIILDHGFGLSTRYAHLSRFAVKPGERVERGAVIGYSGSTGRSTGPHVHYEVWVGGKPINPLRILGAR
jgi:murein DD-endopeptidase MepM/ murein hydrolase activator NlpD